MSMLLPIIDTAAAAVAPAGQVTMPTAAATASSAPAADPSPVASPSAAGAAPVMADHPSVTRPLVNREIYLIRAGVLLAAGVLITFAISRRRAMRQS
jgi:hypothetical protein